MIIQCKQTRSGQKLKPGLRVWCPCDCGSIFTLKNRLKYSIFTLKNTEEWTVEHEAPNGTLMLNTAQIPIQSNPAFRLVEP